MTFYKQNKKQPFRWLIAIIIFILAMTVTFDDVYGIQVSPNKVDNTNKVDMGITMIETPEQTLPPTTAVPEPATIIILGVGMGALYVSRVMRKKFN